MPNETHSVHALEILDSLEFPVTLPELVAFAEDQDASEDALDLIQAMPDREYESIQDVARHLNKLAVMKGEDNLFASESEDEIRHEANAADDPNIARADHRIGNWAASGKGDQI